MASWTTPVIHAEGDVLAVTDYNGVANNTTFLYQKPYILAYNPSAQSLATNTTTQVQLTATVASNYGFSLSSYNVIVPFTGTYCVQAAAGLEGNSNPAVSLMSIYQNGSFTLNGSTVPSYASLDTLSTGGGMIPCNAGDTIGLYAFHTVGGPASIAGGSQSAFLHVFFVGSQ